MKARIYRPAKTATQSGRAGTRRWVLEFEPSAARGREPLMGWTSSADTGRQVRLHFDSRAAALAYTEAQGMECEVQEPQDRKVRPKSYAANFRWGRVG